MPVTQCYTGNLGLLQRYRSVLPLESKVQHTHTNNLDTIINLVGSQAAHGWVFVWTKKDILKFIRRNNNNNQGARPIKNLVGYPLGQEI